MKCAFYETEITSPIGSSMPGYFIDRFTTGVKDKLYCKAFAATDGNTTFAMLEVDACELMKCYSDAIIKRVCEKNDISPQNVAVSVTHAHTGIACGGLTGETVDEEYMKVFVRIAADCVSLAISTMEEADAVFGQGFVDGYSFNRIYRLPDGTIRTQPKRDVKCEHYTENDPLLPILLIKDKQGTPKGALLSFSCHQDCVGGREYSGDYSSEMSIQLKKHFGPEFVSMYITGASGDINHINPDFSNANAKKPELNELPYYRKMGRALAKEAVRVIESGLTPVGDKVSAAYKALEIEMRRATPEMIENAKAIIADPDAHGKATAKALLEYLQNEKEYLHKASVQVFSIGNASIFLLPGELFHRFATKVRNALPNKNCLFSTLSNGWHGYIPTPELVDMYTDVNSNVYEIKLCYGSCLERNAGDIITDTAIALAK